MGCVLIIIFIFCSNKRKHTTSKSTFGTHRHKLTQGKLVMLFHYNQRWYRMPKTNTEYHTLLETEEKFLNNKVLTEI